jgi:hypothetical protein
MAMVRHRWGMIHDSQAIRSIDDGWGDRNKHEGSKKGVGYIIYEALNKSVS